MDVLAVLGIILGVVAYILPQIGIRVIPSQYSGLALLVALGLTVISLIGAIRSRRRY